MSKNLILVRSGDNSLHPHWAYNRDGSKGRQDWDLIVSSYGDKVIPQSHDNEIRHVPEDTKTIGKWWGIGKTLDWLGPRLDDYDYIWTPDDDLLMYAEDINAMFARAKELKLAVCQPSLTRNSHITWASTLNHASYDHRYVTAAEIMAPCYTRDAIERIRFHLSNTLTGWGLEALTAHQLGYPKTAQAVLDTVQMIHTRPVGGDLYKRVLNGKSMTAYEEWMNLCKEFNIDQSERWHWVRSFQGKLRSGRTTGVFETRVRVKLNWLARKREIEKGKLKLFDREKDVPPLPA